MEQSDMSHAADGRTPPYPHAPAFAACLDEALVRPVVEAVYAKVCLDPVLGPMTMPGP